MFKRYISALQILSISAMVVLMPTTLHAQEGGETKDPATQEQTKQKAEEKSEQTPPSSDNTVASKTPKIAPPADFLQQQQDDINHYIEPSIINSMLIGMKEHITLLELNKTSTAKGVIILLPDWQQSATRSNAINFLRKQLPEQGWTTMTIQPPNKPENYPSYAPTPEKRIENNQKTLTDYQEELAGVVKAVTEKAKEYPGIIVVISEGSNAAILTRIYHQQLSDIPSAFVLLSGFLPTIADTQTTANSITQLSIPVLDLTLYRDNIHVAAAAKRRFDAVKQEMKPHYRQKQLHNITPSQYPKKLLLKEINGWLAAIGW